MARSRDEGVKDGPGNPASSAHGYDNHFLNTEDHTPEADPQGDLNDGVPFNQETDEELLIAALQRLDVTTPQSLAPPTLTPPFTKVTSDLSTSTQLYAYQSPPRSAGLRQALLGPTEEGRGPQLHDDFIGESPLREDLTTSDVSGPGIVLFVVSWERE